MLLDELAAQKKGNFEKNNSSEDLDNICRLLLLAHKVRHCFVRNRLLTEREDRAGEYFARGRGCTH